MLALRSFFSRPQPLLSRLRRIHCEPSQLPTVLGNRNLINFEGYASNRSSGNSHTEINRQQHLAAAAAATKQHLYVVLDDHKDGYGIHKLDMAGDVGDLDGSAAPHLPEPPVLRVAFPAVGELAQFAAVGSSIVAVGTCPSMSPYETNYVGGVLIYDTKTTAQVVSPQLPKTLVYGYEAAMAIGNRLYMLESCGTLDSYCRCLDWCDSGLHCLTSDSRCGVDGGKDNKFWGWLPLSPSSPWCWSQNEALLALPFNARNITAHAVHVPPGAASHEHDIFVSASSTWNSRLGATFSFGRHDWTHRGDWELPVVGHAHYDSELDTWLGLHAVDHGNNRHTDGRLCTGYITSAPPEWKVGREKLFRLDEESGAGWSHIDAKLVPTSPPGEGRAEYCLMERLRPEKDKDEESLGDGDKCLLCLTNFRVEYGEDGEPVAMDRRPTRSYKVSRYNKDFDAQVFCM